MESLLRQRVQEVDLKCRRNLPPHVLVRLRHEARTNAYEAGILSPYRRFTYLQSNSEESYESGWMD